MMCRIQSFSIQLILCKSNWKQGSLFPRTCKVLIHYNPHIYNTNANTSIGGNSCTVYPGVLALMWTTMLHSLQKRLRNLDNEWHVEFQSHIPATNIYTVPVLQTSNEIRIITRFRWHCYRPKAAPSGSSCPPRSPEIPPAAVNTR